MRFKPRDRVRIKNLDWYNQNKDENGYVFANEFIAFTEEMSYYCGKIMTIEKVDDTDNSYLMDGYWWTDDMIESLAERKPQLKLSIEKGFELPSECRLFVEKDWDKKQEINIQDGYEFQDENGNVIIAKKIVVVKKKPKYPATYEECCKVLHYDYGQGITMRGVTEDEEDLFRILIVLKRCRDAYWKIADWKPDYISSEPKYYINTYNDKIDAADMTLHCNRILAFPTKEMRDAFYENFKDLVESCKELL